MLDPDEHYYDQIVGPEDDIARTVIQDFQWNLKANKPSLDRLRTEEIAYGSTGELYVALLRTIVIQDFYHIYH